MHPYGEVFIHEKLNVAFMDYLSQIALNMKEPGLLRMFLHKGSLRDKLVCLGFSNAMQELRRHRFTLFFFRSFHEALHGRRPGLISRFKVTPDFRPLIRAIDEIARARSRDRKRYMELLKTGSSRMFSCLNQIIAKRVASRAGHWEHLDRVRNKNLADLIQQLELPSHVRALFEEDPEPTLDHGSRINLSDFFDALTFPVLAWGVIAGASLLSTRVLMGQREFVNGFARSLGRHVHPRRVLWLTDTLCDDNGVSTSLSRKLSFIQERDLPIDFLVCHDRIQEAPHLKVVPPVGSFTVPGYPDHVFQVPDLLAVQALFIQGGYDRIICSTELLMGLAALYSRTDLLVLPSRFDTFGNVILEAMSCGAAVAAYAEKGPLEIIQTRENGILAEDPAGLAEGIARFVRDETFRHTLKKNSLRRARSFSRDTIFNAFLNNLGLGDTVHTDGTDSLSERMLKKETLKAAIGY
jgi:glycosyltransferase involved in cell wall biosynthesis